jgi:hypothetical protein
LDEPHDQVVEVRHQRAHDEHVGVVTDRDAGGQLAGGRRVGRDQPVLEFPVLGRQFDG